VSFEKTYEKLEGRFYMAIEGADVIGHIYFIQNAVTGNVKIGRAKDVTKRLQALQTASDCPLRLLFSLDVHQMVTEERILHERFSDYHITGEWFRYEGELYGYIQALIWGRVKTAREWKIEQEFARKELIYNAKKSKKPQKAPTSVRLARQLAKKEARKLRRKLRKQQIDRMLQRV
jgi:hypothetical protein